MNEHLILIGLNFRNRKSTGDKNFWVDLLPYLSRFLKRISVISLCTGEEQQETVKIDGCDFSVHYLSPRFLASPESGLSGTGKTPRLWKGGRFPALWGVVEKLVSLRRIAALVKEIARRHPVSHVHLMDNFGPGNRWLVGRLKSLTPRISLAAIAYMGRLAFFYHPYLRLSYNIPGIRVVVYSHAYREKLLGLGIKSARLVHIPWGVQPQTSSPGAEEMQVLKQEMGLPPQAPLLLWAGFTQQIGEEDFYYALQVARRAIRRGIRASFYFAFKPESIKKYYTSEHNPARGVYIQATTVEEFSVLKRAASLLYVPFYEPSTILTPPLTWLECMALGKPLLTTAVKGIEAVIEDGKNGWIASGTKQLRDLLLDECAGGPDLASACRERVRLNFNIQEIAPEYLRLWGLAGEDAGNV